MKALPTLLLTISLGLFGGCATVTGSAEGAPSREQIQQENQLILAVERALVSRDAQFDRLPVNVFALGRDLVLIGQVPDSQLRQLALDTTLAVPGVEGVHNHIMIGPTRAASISAHDSLLAIQARTRLSTNRDLPSRHWRVEVDYGRAFVIGNLSAEQQQQVIHNLQQVNGLQSIVLIVN